MNPESHLRKLRAISKKDDKTKGYGGTKEKYEDFFLPRFKVIVYRKGPYLVVDRYTGEEQNIGEAVTLYRKRPVYGINYYGKLLTRKFKAKELFKFLKKALLAGAGKTLHRGLDGFRENGFLYRNSFSEKRKFLEGEEKIFYRNKLIFIQVYHGGVIEDSRSDKEWGARLLSSKKLMKKIDSELAF